MKDKFFSKKVDYFWELEYPFAEYFLKEIFGDKFLRKYLLQDSGIVNLIFVDNKIYEVKMTQARGMVEADGQITRDQIKNDIVYLICEELGNNNIQYNVNKGKFITFMHGNFIIKLEIIKKLREPR